MKRFIYADRCVLCGDPLAPDSLCLCVACQKQARKQTKLERLDDVKKMVKRVEKEGR